MSILCLSDIHFRRTAAPPLYASSVESVGAQWPLTVGEEATPLRCVVCPYDRWWFVGLGGTMLFLLSIPTLYPKAKKIKLFC